MPKKGLVRLQRKERLFGLRIDSISIQSGELAFTPANAMNTLSALLLAFAECPLLAKSGR